MTRLLLVGAMVLSLWPSAVVALSFLGGDAKTTESGAPAADTTTDASTDTTYDTTDTGPEAAAPVTSDSGSTADPSPAIDISGLTALHDRTHRLLQQLDKSRSLHGTSDPALAQRARALARSWRIWAAKNDVDRSALRYAHVAEQLVERERAFALAPSQALLDRLNEEISAYNRAVRRVS